MTRDQRDATGRVLAVVIAVGLLIALGTWQLQRRTWKEALLSHIHSQMTAPPTLLPLAITDPLAWDYRPVLVAGRFRHDLEMPILARTFQGHAGADIITPLQRPDGSIVLINRGWVPEDRRDLTTRRSGAVDGLVLIAGIARVPPGQGLFQPDSRPERNEWYWLDRAGMARHAGFAAVAPVFVEADATPNAGGWPIGGRTRIDIPNDHLQYALTWYGLAVTLVVIYGFWLRNRRVPEPRPVR